MLHTCGRTVKHTGVQHYSYPIDDEAGRSVEPANPGRGILEALNTRLSEDANRILAPTTVAVALRKIIAEASPSSS